MFHVLRRQMLRHFRKPLILMTPKSLLRHELSVSALQDFSRGGFAPVIGEIDEIPVEPVRRIVFCAGKVYFDLLKARRKEALLDVALVRIEQLYPFPGEEYAAVLRQYPNAREIIWCQEEPQNQGAWYQIRHRLQEFAGERREVLYAGRASAAAPATGLIKVHEAEQQGIVQAALHASAAADTVAADTPAAIPVALRKSS
jgi:2-oxoglutarate dehydrogenase E1 component